LNWLWRALDHRQAKADEASPTASAVPATNNVTRIRIVRRSGARRD
jgi:hypothetical protein